MKEHPINDIVKTSLQSINMLVDVNKVIGEPIILPNDIIAIPVSKVICGFGVGGSEFKNNKTKQNVNSEISNELYPFGGASGGGLTMMPQALIIIKDNKVQLMNIDKDNDILPIMFDTIKEMFKK